MFGKHCARADELEALAFNQRVAGGVERHVRTCDVCTRVLARLREDAGLLADLREALLDAASDVHQRVAAIYDEVAAESRRSGPPRS